MSRNISDNGLHFTAAFEGFRGTAYRATSNEKYLTIGYGHYGPDVTPGKTITPGQGLLLLNRDMAKAVAAVDAAAHHSLTQAQFDAVCDCAPSWRCSSTRTANHYWACAAVQLGDWRFSMVNRGRRQKLSGAR